MAVKLAKTVSSEIALLINCWFLSWFLESYSLILIGDSKSLPSKVLVGGGGGVLFVTSKRVRWGLVGGGDYSVRTDILPGNKIRSKLRASWC